MQEPSEKNDAVVLRALTEPEKLKTFVNTGGSPQDNRELDAGGMAPGIMPGMGYDGGFGGQGPMPAEELQRLAVQWADAMGSESLRVKLAQFLLGPDATGPQIQQTSSGDRKGASGQHPGPIADVPERQADATGEGPARAVFHPVQFAGLGPRDENPRRRESQREGGAGEFAVGRPARRPRAGGRRARPLERRAARPGRRTGDARRGGQGVGVPGG